MCVPYLYLLIIDYNLTWEDNLVFCKGVVSNRFVLISVSTFTMLVVSSIYTLKMIRKMDS